jgi:rSAM/selenodomain-associated transferase 1
LQDQALIIFFKTPVLGRVKTRLASEIGNKKALLIYELMLRQVISSSKKWAERGENRLLLPFGNGDPQSWRKYGIENGFQQIGSDLGLKMQHAMQFALQKAKQVAIIGTDSPDILPMEIEQAFLQLSRADVSFGPCLDGGYYLMACNKLPPTLLWDLPWSCSTTLARLRNRCEGHHLSMDQLDMKRDIDTLEDLISHRFGENILEADV